MEYSKKNFTEGSNKDGGMGETKVCDRCGRIFNYLGFGHYYCPTCKKLDEEDFIKVKEYIYDNGVASALEVSEMTGVSVKLIGQYLREGRLEIPENSPIFIKCEKCSVHIRSGRLCPNCATSLSNAVRMEMDFGDNQIGAVPNKLVGKMHFFGKKK